MCTNRALVDSLECYMDDLVDCFEDFVKKSIIAISVAIGVLVAMIAYVLKIIADRSQPASTTGDISRRNSQNFRNRNILDNNVMIVDGQDNKGTCTITAPCADTQNQGEVLKDTGISACSKLNCSLSKTRLSIPSLQTTCKKCSTSKLNKKSLKAESCCSMCCDDMCDR